MSESKCCFSGFQWNGKPAGRTEKVGSLPAYVAGNNSDAAILIVHDGFGWTFDNARLLADHFAAEANATVYLPDFFDGEVLPVDALLRGEWAKIDIKGFRERHSREIREPEIFECARALRQKHKKLGAVGFCFGGWACFRLAAKEHDPPLVDCISVGHPTLTTNRDIDEVAVPVQILAPEHDSQFTPELKLHSFETFVKSNRPFDFQYFPGVQHGAFIRGDEEAPGEREAMIRAKNAAVAWFLQFSR